MQMDRNMKIVFRITIFLYLIINWKVQAFDSSRCPRMVFQIFDGYAPIGNKTAGKYTEDKTAFKIDECVLNCCRQQYSCNVAFIYNQTCYNVECENDELCLPLQRPNVTSILQMVLVHPTTEEKSWEDSLKARFPDFITEYPKLSDPGEKNLFDRIYSRQRSKIPVDEYVDQGTGLSEQFYNDLISEESFKRPQRLQSCIFGSLNAMCGKNEECKLIARDSNEGACVCTKNYIRNIHDRCVMDSTAPDDANVPDNTENLTEKLIMIKELKDRNFLDSDAVENAQETIQKLSVSVMSKTVQLPEKEVTLAAFTVPDEKTSTVAYKYAWTLITQPQGDVNGSMSDKTKDKLTLSNLSEGFYRFKVEVSGKGWYGETIANVTVFPEKRVNKAPNVTIIPKSQIIKLPTNKAILDGSTSKDDDQIKSWHWDLIQGPIGYQPVLLETSTLQLTNLTLPGNYTFKLTVTDSNDVKNSTTASINVLKIIDYPPEANAGNDIIVKLPENKAILNGSESTDDHKIVAWEWTKDSSDESKAVDMQNTRTPYLQLSNLEKGVYTFVLKVTDASNQSSTANVHVFVKEPENKQPIAIAGQNVTINLPQNWMTLNATNSSDDIKVKGYQWSQLDGPNKATILNDSVAITNATGLTVGVYTFQLYVFDENNNNATDRVMITVVQDKNTAPVAHAGGDQSITMPVNAIHINGSKSYDDLGIVSYEWTRDSTSLAIGTTVGNTSSEPVLIVTNVIPGRYVFKLTVRDAQGLTGSDTVSIIVRPDPLLMNLVELTFTVGVSVLTESELQSLEQKVVLILGNNIKLVVRDLQMEPKTGEAILVFYVEKITGGKGNELMPGTQVEKILNDKLWRDSSIFGSPISDVRTKFCQNKCSGHGTCNTQSRACMCETFWMPSIFYFWGLSEANCDWSILYVVISVFILFLIVSGICWSITSLCRRSTKRRQRVKTQKYALLESNDKEIRNMTRGTSLSDSETDSDVLFENKSKQNGLIRKNGIARNGQKAPYATTRLGRKINA